MTFRIPLSQMSLRNIITYRPCHFVMPALKTHVAGYGTWSAESTGLLGCLVIAVADIS